MSGSGRVPLHSQVVSYEVSATSFHHRWMPCSTAKFIVWRRGLPRRTVSAGPLVMILRCAAHRDFARNVGTDLGEDLTPRHRGRQHFPFEATTILRRSNFPVGPSAKAPV
jgi:hypothetical protein